MADSKARHSVAASIPVDDWEKLYAFTVQNRVKVADVIKSLVHKFVIDMPEPEPLPEPDEDALAYLFN